MKKIIIIFLWLLTTIVFLGCSSDKEIDALKEQNALLKQQIGALTDTGQQAQNVVIKSASKQSSTDTYLGQQMENSKLKQQRINEARQKKNICYSNIDEVLAIASSKWLCEWSSFLDCESVENQFRAEAIADCDDKYEDNLRVINLEY